VGVKRAVKEWVKRGQSGAKSGSLQGEGRFALSIRSGCAPGNAVDRNCHHKKREKWTHRNANNPGLEKFSRRPKSMSSIKKNHFERESYARHGEIGEGGGRDWSNRRDHGKTVSNGVRLAAKSVTQRKEAQTLLAKREKLESIHGTNQERCRWGRSFRCYRVIRLWTGGTLPTGRRDSQEEWGNRRGGNFNWKQKKCRGKTRHIFGRIAFRGEAPPWEGVGDGGIKRERDAGKKGGLFLRRGTNTFKSRRGSSRKEREGERGGKAQAA